METLQFTTTIKAPASKVWETLWNDTTYRQWTSAFHAGSYAVSEWKEGDPIQFLATDGGGMYSVIEKKIPNEFMSFRHIGEVKNFEEQPLTEETNGWSGSHENYSLEESNGETILNVYLDSMSEFAAYFSKAFPPALELIKDISEGTIKPSITIEATVNAPIEKVWDYWTNPEHVIHWTNASDDWHAPRATNDLRTGGKFFTRMEAKDGSMGFDFEGSYSNVQDNNVIEYDLADDRHIKVTFTQQENGVRVIETFDPENENPHEMQRFGWQAILNNFKKYTEQ